MQGYIGLDLGGTKTMVVFTNKEGKAIKTLREDTPLDLESGVTLVKKMIKDIAIDNNILAIGVAIGPIDKLSRTVSPLHQLQWQGVEFWDILEEEFNCSAYIDVDTNVAAIGEYYLGDFTQKYFMYITLSTGMGGGFLIDGNVYEGLCHPEVAHQAINYKCSYPKNIQCECGVQDCLACL